MQQDAQETTAGPEAATITKRGRPPREVTEARKTKALQIAKKRPHASIRQIAAETGISRTTAADVLSKYGIKKNELDEFKDNRADIYAGTIARIVNSIDDETIKNASLRDRATAAGILQDKERLERGQSTTNVASLHSIAERAIKAVSIVNDQNPPEGINTSNAGSVTDND